MAMQLLHVTFSASLWYTKHKARDVSVPIFFVLQLFANTACLFDIISGKRLLSLCYILVAPCRGWNNTDIMIHADYYIYIGLLRVS